MSEDKDKDRMLRQIQSNTPLESIDCLDKYLPELEKDGYVKVRYTTDHRPFHIRLTPGGTRFMERGGYTKTAQQKQKSIALKGMRWFLVTVAGAALVLLTNLLITRWLSK